MTLATLAVSVVLPCRCTATLLDWSTVTWPAGNLSQTFTGIDPNNPGTSVTVTVTGDTGAFSSGYPTDATSPLTGGTISDSSLQLALAFPNTSSNITVTVAFNYGAAGVQNVNFTLFDIDLGTQGSKTTYVDQISNISGQFDTNAPVAATITNVPGSATYTVANNGTLSATITGTANNPDTAGNGNATIDFGTNLINQMSFTYGNGPGVSVKTPGGQAIALFDINFSPNVPETRPALVAVLLCGLAIGWRALVARRVTPTA